MSKKLFLVASSIAALALSAPSIAVAQTHFERFMAVDTNHDGAISRQEMEQGRVALFNRADSNRDDSISQTERDAIRGQLGTSANAAQIDKNSNGVITRTEFMSRPYPAFDRFDADHNDVLEASEIATIRARAAEVMDYH